MNTLTKLALGMLGQLKPQPAQGTSPAAIALPAPRMQGGMGLMEALQRRQSRRAFAATALTSQETSDLLWACAGVNRPELGGRTAPSALNAQEIDVYAAMPGGLYLYDAKAHALDLAANADVRRVSGYQDFVDQAPLELIFVADHSRMKLVAASKREPYAWVAAGAMAQNCYLHCAAVGLACVIRAWIDRSALTAAMGLDADKQVLLAQTVGWPQFAHH